MQTQEFRASIARNAPPDGVPAPLAALWWDAKGDWARAHALVDELESPEGMAVHAYLHRKEGEDWNADYWYLRAGRQYQRPELEDEWLALAQAVLGRTRCCSATFTGDDGNRQGARSRLGSI